MLLQHHVADLLTPRMPDGWEEEMLESGKLPQNEDDRAGRRENSRRTGRIDDEEASFTSEDGLEEVGMDGSEGRDDEEYVPRDD